MICTAHLRNPEPRLTLSNNTSSADYLVTDKAAEKAISTSGFISYTLCILPPRSLCSVSVGVTSVCAPAYPAEGFAQLLTWCVLKPTITCVFTSRTCVFRAEIISERKRESENAGRDEEKETRETNASSFSAVCLRNVNESEQSSSCLNMPTNTHIRRCNTAQAHRAQICSVNTSGYGATVGNSTKSYFLCSPDGRGATASISSYIICFFRAETNEQRG